MFDIGHNHQYFDDQKNMEVCRKVARKCYLPMNRILLDLIREYRGQFKIAFSITGVALEQFRDYAPEVIESFRELAKTGCVEFLSETYYHSLAYLYSKDEFESQVAMHRALMQELFGQTPRVFRNTELIYNNELANFVEGMGYEGIIAEGWDAVLGWRSPNFLYQSEYTSTIKTLLKNYKLSDDIAFRFGNKGWEEHPLTTEKFVRWLSSVNGNGHSINLFMDYETFGEHQWEDTGIFDFMRYLPRAVLDHPDNDFKTPTEVVRTYPTVGRIDAHHFISWADVERDLTAWLGNRMQTAAIRELYALEHAVKATNDHALIESWRRLTTSDHYYYMCTKWFSDGDVHKYFSPYESPYEGYIAFMNVLQDLRLRLDQHVQHAVQKEEQHRLRNNHEYERGSERSKERSKRSEERREEVAQVRSKRSEERSEGNEERSKRIENSHTEHSLLENGAYP
jgi:alpha-amylase